MIARPMTSRPTTTRAGNEMGCDGVEPCSPTLANTAGCIERNLVASHKILDQIDQAINGPPPPMSEKPTESCGGGLMATLGECNTSAHNVLRRLEGILSAIEHE